MPRTPRKWWRRRWPQCPRNALASAGRRWRTPSSPIGRSCPNPRARNWTSSLASTSCNDLAERLLAHCLNGERRPDALLDQLVTPDCSDALFRVVVERLADLFEPRLCDVYAELFSQVIAGAILELKAPELRARYDRVRWPRRFQGDAGRVENVFVLSRITLGADAAITSVLL